jgi:thiosulfate dehydrogenase [quinone] large subunit
MQNTFKIGTTHEAGAITDSPIARFLFSDTRLAWLWLPLRVWLGWSWLQSGWGKIQNPAWIDNGSALQSFWSRAVVLEPKPVISFDWYRDFIDMMLATGAYTWFAKVIVFGELTIGILLILGAFTGLAAFGGGLLNWSFVMAGTASTNALLFAMATWLVLAWKTASWIGLDRWLLQALGTPWRPGFMVRRAPTHEDKAISSVPVPRVA